MGENENIQDTQPKTGKWRKRVKWILMGLWFFVGFCLLRMLCSVFYYFLYLYVDGAGRTFTILLPLFIEILIVYFIILWKTRKGGWKDKLKKSLKYSLIILSPFLLLSTLAFFTKNWIISNWLEIEWLCPWSSSYRYNCYSINEYENYEDESECWRILNIKWYLKRNYDRWTHKKSKEEIGIFYSHGDPFINWYKIRQFKTLTDMPYYDERLDDKFEKYKNQIIECEDKRYKNYEKYFTEKKNWAKQQDTVWNG